MDVSRETRTRLERFAALLERWNRKINLISSADIPHLWDRHILDSAQLLALAPRDAGSWLDLGSGAGLPGMVIAICAAEQAAAIRVTLVESDQRKCAFLREAAREAGVSVVVENRRIEDLPAQKFDVISARALAPLPRLFSLAVPFCHEATCLLFPKGRHVESELTDAAEDWHSRVERIVSRTDAESTILRITELSPRS